MGASLKPPQSPPQDGASDLQGHCFLKWPEFSMIANESNKYGRHFSGGL